MIKYYCDHCGKEIIGMRYEVECTIYPTAGARIIHRGELCDKCSDRLGRFLDPSRFLAPSEEIEEEEKYE